MNTKQSIQRIAERLEELANTQGSTGTPSIERIADALEKLDISGGGGGDDPDVLFNGSLTFTVMGSPSDPYCENTEAFTMTRLPEDSETAYLYVDGDLIGNSNWAHYDASGDGPETYELVIEDGSSNELASVYYANDSGWGGYLDIKSGSFSGEHSVEIRKTSKSGGGGTGNGVMYATFTLGMTGTTPAITGCDKTAAEMVAAVEGGSELIGRYETDGAYVVFGLDEYWNNEEEGFGVRFRLQKQDIFEDTLMGVSLIIGVAGYPGEDDIYEFIPQTYTIMVQPMNG